MPDGRELAAERGGGREVPGSSAFFHGINRFRAIAGCYGKTATSFLAAVHVACIQAWLN
jgi:hypothetical protein